MKFIKTYLPEIIFVAILSIFWTFVFAYTNVGHSNYEIFMSLLLVLALNCCAFMAFHGFFQMRRWKALTKKPINLLLIIKPDGLEHTNQILKEMGQYGKLHDLVITPYLPREPLEKHYEHIKDESFFEPTIDYMMSGPVILGILTCDNESDITRARTALGATNPANALPNTLRGRFGTVDGDIVKNVAHLSDSSESGEREIDIWKDILYKPQPTIIGKKVDSIVKNS